MNDASNSDAIDSTTARGDANGKVGEAATLQQTLARNENKAVRRLRLVVILMLMVVAILASVGIFFYSRNTEKREFENEFTSQGLKVIIGFQGDSFRKLQAMESLSNSFTAYATLSGEKWPFVTIPDSAQHFEPYLSLTNAASLLMMPIVGPRQRYEWETYSAAKQGWIDQDLKTRRDQDQRRHLLEGSSSNSSTSTMAVGEDLKISRYIKNYVGIDTSPASWIVWWQYAPVIPNRFFVNFNRLAWDGFAEEVEAVQEGKAILSKTWTFKPGLDLQSTKDFDFTQELLQEGRHGKYESGEPIGYIHYPVFDSYENDERKTVAILTATVYWRTYMQDLLPESGNIGIVCVIKNSQGQEYTYEINGPDAVFLGSGDLHNRDYSDQVISADYASFENSQSGWYTGVPVDTDHISYSIHVYPSSEFEDSYMTNKPIIYATAIFVVFLFTVSIFIIYDCYVERRQNIVMNSAVKTNAVVETLFPSNVRDQIMDNAVEQQQQKTQKCTDNAKAFLSANQEQAPINGSKPIADIFEETTIYFADLVGFTAWSSKRTPTEVFELLETLYGAFDKIARRRKVFKVETIGDCYVAVTGIPQPQKRHAVIMARFAKDCMVALNQTTRELADTLGQDTVDLEMRVGLHSGATTAGVLRGDKGRFQLFGDTVNTASRMESNGVRNRIHVSQATADALIAAGKESWLVAREDKISAKGKGLMQTYFVNVSETKSATTMSVGTRSSDVNDVSNACGDLDVPPRDEQVSEIDAVRAYEVEV